MSSSSLRILSPTTMPRPRAGCKVAAKVGLPSAPGSRRRAETRCKCIWIDDAICIASLDGVSERNRVTEKSSAAEAARAFAALFPEVYLRYHVRDRERGLTPQMAAVLRHLAMAGPLTVTEAARHFGRAQSVASGILAGLERKGLVERIRDRRDRRRTLVWLTDAGHDAVAREHRVLDETRL